MALTKVTYTDNVTVIGADNLNDIQDEIIRLDADKADLDSPALTGTPTAPTPTEGDSSTKIATTEFVEKKADSTYITGSASGEIATFPDGADGVPVQSLTAEINAVQNLNGYDKPWVGGSGKNKLECRNAPKTENGLTFTYNNGWVTVNGTATANTTYRVATSLDIPSGNYIMSGCPSGGSATTYYMRMASAGNDIGSGYSLTYDSTNPHNIDITVVSGTTCSNVVFKPMIRLATESDATWQPYENICPISGYSSVNVVDSSDDNLLRNTVWTDGYRFNSAGGLLATDGYSASDWIAVQGGATINLNYSMSTYVCICEYSANDFNTFITRTTSGTSVTLASNTTYIRVSIATDKKTFVCATYGTVTTTTISLGSNIYGGTLDVTNGVLTVDYAMVDLGTLPWSYESSNKFFYAIINFALNRTDLITEKYVSVGNKTDAQMATVADGGFSPATYASGTKTMVKFKNTSYTDVASFTASVDGDKLVYPLRESQTVTLTPTQVQTVLGQNNIWADSGSVSVVYRADTQIKIAETSWNFLGTCLSGATVTLTLPNDWTGIVRIWYPYQTTALRYYEIYAICDSNGAVYQFAVSNTSTITLTQAQNTLTLTILSSTNPNTYYFTCEGSGKITATGLE